MTRYAGLGFPRLAGGVIAVGMLLTAPAARAQNLITNGTFAITGGAQSFQFGTFDGYVYQGESLSGWSSPGGYNMVYASNGGAATDIWGSLTLWSPAVGSNNGFTNTSPTGGDFIAGDADYGIAPIVQTVSGLTVGKTYKLSFAWAGAQQGGFTGQYNADWQVTFGSSTQTTPVVTVASEGFSGWMNQSFSFVATSSTQVLSFLAQDTSGGSNLPSFALLANVSLTPAPEPAGLTILGTGLFGLLSLVRRRARVVTADRHVTPI